MAKRRKTESTVERAAEAVGHALGSIAGKVDSFQAEHPHPVQDARNALTAAERTLATARAGAGARAGAVVRKTKAAVRRVTKVATRSQSRREKVAAGVKRSARSAVKRTKKAVKAGRKAVGRIKRRLKR